MKEQRTLRSKRLRAALWIAADGKCQICGNELGDDWHADHVVPWVISKRTNVHEMQALCPACNLFKGKKMIVYRKHQAEMIAKSQEIAAAKKRFRMLAHVACGAGKSWLPPLFLKHMPKDMHICWVVPRLALQSQAVVDAKDNFGLQLRDAKNEINPLRGCRGIVITHQSFSLSPELWASEFALRKYVLIVDEPHHAKVTRKDELNQLSTAISICADKVFGLIYMTGTLHTSDSRLIYGVNYEHDFATGGDVPTSIGFDHYIRYSRLDALQEGAIVPIEFFHGDGPVKWESLSNGKEIETVLSKADKDQEGDAIWTAISTELAESLFDRGYLHWKKHGDKLLIVCHSQQSAKKYHDALLAKGEKSFLAVTENEDALDHINKFKRTGRGCLVTCAMAYEGLDDKSLSHVVALTHIRSIPWIEQMLARVWRAKPGKDRCYAFVPDDPRMNRIIESIKIEQADCKRMKIGGCGPGPGPGDRDAIPIGSSHSFTRRSGLDVDVEASRYNTKQQQAYDALMSLGIAPESEGMRKVLDELSESLTPKANGHITPRERESALRREIASICRSMDFETENEPGTYQKKLFRVTKKSTKDMNEEELRKALQYVKTQFAR